MYGDHPRLYSLCRENHPRIHNLEEDIRSYQSLVAFLPRIYHKHIPCNVAALHWVPLGMTAEKTWRIDNKKCNPEDEKQHFLTIPFTRAAHSIHISWVGFAVRIGWTHIWIDSSTVQHHPVITNQRHSRVTNICQWQGFNYRFGDLIPFNILYCDGLTIHSCLASVSTTIWAAEETIMTVEVTSAIFNTYPNIIFREFRAHQLRRSCGEANKFSQGKEAFYRGYMKKTMQLHLHRQQKFCDPSLELTQLYPNGQSPLITHFTISPLSSLDGSPYSHTPEKEIDLCITNLTR